MGKNNVDEVVAVYVPKNPFTPHWENFRTKRVAVPYDMLRGYTKEQIQQMAENAAKTRPALKGFRLARINGLEKLFPESTS